ncbi:flagellar hook-length control protein FliK [Streptomyces sp. bgisy082]|uniref:flagellar hook-length control protein FliK n=1 Tax=unclassified Streptomyces TaxID=2593676 RepID=UPI003D735623
MTRSTCGHVLDVARAAVLSLALVLGLTGLGLATAPEATALNGKGTAGPCPSSSGVTVVVDFQELGGGTVVRCAPGDQATGLAALKNAGFTIAGTQRWGEAFVCRIEGKPTAATEACVNTPPASAYWSYWHAPNGGTWGYSQSGASGRKPAQGSFEGWSFSLNKTSSTNPAPRVAPVRP